MFTSITEGHDEHNDINPSGTRCQKGSTPTGLSYFNFSHIVQSDSLSEAPLLPSGLIYF